MKQHHDLIKAFRNKLYFQLELRGNKGTVLNALVSREVWVGYQDEIQPHLASLEQVEQLKDVEKLKNPIAIWYHPGSANLCAGNIVRLIPESEHPQWPEPEIMVIAVACGVSTSAETLYSVQQFEQQIEEAVRRNEQKTRFEAYAAIPELHELMNSHNINPEDF